MIPAYLIGAIITGWLAALIWVNAEDIDLLRVDTTWPETFVVATVVAICWPVVLVIALAAGIVAAIYFWAVGMDRIARRLRHDR